MNGSDSAEKERKEAAAKAAAPDRIALEELITEYCRAWSEPDPARRQRLLQQVWDEAGIYTDPTVHAEGRAALAGHIGNVLKKYPGATVSRTSAIDCHHMSVRFAWHMVLASGETLPEGIDFGEISRDGKLRRIVGFFGALRPLVDKI